MAQTKRRKATKKNSDGSQLQREMWGIIFLGFALLLGGALFSLVFGDGRLMGPFGQALALALFSLLGLGSFLVVVALFSVAWGIFSRRFQLANGRLWLGYTGATICGTVLFWLLFPRYRLHGLSAGGKTGEVLGALGISLVSHVGSFILFGVGLLLFLMLATQSSPARTIVALVEGTVALFAWLGRMLSALGRFLVNLFRWEPLEDGEEDEDGEEEGAGEAEDGETADAPAGDAARRPQKPLAADELNQKKKTPTARNGPAASKPADVENHRVKTTAPLPSGMPPEIAAEPDGSGQKVPSARPEQKTGAKPAEAGSAREKPANAAPSPDPAPASEPSGPSPAQGPAAKAEAWEETREEPAGAPERLPAAVAENVATPAPAEEIPADSDPVIAGTSEPLSFGPRIIEETIHSGELAPVTTFTDDWGEFHLPDPELLYYEPPRNVTRDKDHMLALAARLEQAFQDYKIKGRVQEIHVGPVVTMYEFVPEAGVRVSRIESLAKDLAMSLAATRVRIVAPLPGKSAVGIEVPNESPQLVYLKEIVADPAFAQSRSKLTMAMGKDIKGRAVVMDLAKAPHLLIAGTTGSGKSVGVNAMLLSILFRASPRDVRLILIDPKMVEFSVYNDIPHLLLPVVTDPQQANLALQWAVREMERRYQALSELGVRDLADYNQKADAIRQRGIEGAPEHLPFIVIVIDEFADLMMVAAKEVETAVARIAQKARAVGIHLITATQRPSTDVITGLIKSNFPTRIAFMVASRIDSKVILDQMGAEALLGNGDMLWSNRGLSPVRVHGAFVSTAEVQAVVDHLRAQGRPSYDMSIVVSPEEDGGFDDEPLDSKWEDALDVVARDRIASISYIQRRLKIGYNRAARIVERMEHEGIVSPPNGTNQREVLIPPR